MATVFVVFILIVGMLTLIPDSAARFSIVPAAPDQTGCGCTTTLMLLAILVVLLILRFA